MTSHGLGLRLVVLVTLTAALAVPTRAQTASVVPFTFNGDGIDGSVGAPVALTSTSFLVSTTGPDFNVGTADDVTLLVTDVGTTPTVLALATPFLSDFSGQMTYMSASRALVIHGGLDGVFNTADDGVYLIEVAGPASTVTSIVTGALNENDGSSPERLSANSAVLATLGADLTADTADDRIALLTDLGGTNTLTQLVAPFLPDSGRSKPTALTETSFLVSSSASNDEGGGGTPDDQVYLFRNVGTLNNRVDLETPALFSRAPGRAVRVSDTRALVSGQGEDEEESTQDDIVYLLDALGPGGITVLEGGGPTVDFFGVPNIFDFGSGRAVPLTSTTAVLATEGSDPGEGGGADQQQDGNSIAVITNLGSSNTVTQVIVGGLDEDAQSLPIALTSTVVAFATTGPDNEFDDDDDEVVIISDVGGANIVDRVGVGGIASRITSQLARLSDSAVILTSGGPDDELDSSDDVVTLITGLPSAGSTSSVGVGTIDDDANLGFVPEVMGSGRAVLLNTGDDGDLGEGIPLSDDGATVIDGLPGDLLSVKKARLKFKAEQPQKGEKAKVQADLELADPMDFSATDLTVIIGNASQVIPAANFELKSNVIRYRDKKNELGFIRNINYNFKKGRLKINARGENTGIETTHEDYVVVGLWSTGLDLAEALNGESKNNGIKYKR